MSTVILADAGGETIALVVDVDVLHVPLGDTGATWRLGNEPVTVPADIVAAIEAYAEAADDVTLDDQRP